MIRRPGPGRTPRSLAQLPQPLGPAGVETTTRDACAARLRLGSIRARVRPPPHGGNGSLRPPPDPVAAEVARGTGPSTPAAPRGCESWLDVKKLEAGEG